MSDHMPTTPDAANQQPNRDVAPKRPRTSPIVWGALILLFCAYVLQQAISPGSVDSTTWIIATVIGLGVLLLGVAVAVILRSRRGSR